MEESRTTFGRALRAERESKGGDWTQKHLADLVGTTQQNIGHWESGRSLPKEDAFEKLVEIFGPDSPIAALPPRREIPSRREIPAGAARINGLAEQLPQEMRQQWAETHDPSPGAFAKELPPRLRPYADARVVDPMGVTGEVDYLSPRLCAEIVRVSRNLVDSARRGLFTLAVTRGRVDPRPLWHLCIVLSDLDTIIEGRGLSTVLSEARAVGADVYFFNSFGAVAHHVEATEDRELYPHEVDKLQNK